MLDCVGMELGLFIVQVRILWITEPTPLKNF